MLLLGVNPDDIRGSRTGVFVGCLQSDTYDMLCANIEHVTGLEFSASLSTMIANRLSYFFDFKGACCTRQL